MLVKLLQERSVLYFGFMYIFVFYLILTRISSFSCQISKLGTTHAQLKIWCFIGMQYCYTLVKRFMHLYISTFHLICMCLALNYQRKFHFVYKHVVYPSWAESVPNLEYHGLFARNILLCHSNIFSTSLC